MTQLETRTSTSARHTGKGSPSSVRRACQLNRLLPTLIAHINDMACPAFTDLAVAAGATGAETGADYPAALRQQMICGAAVYRRFFVPADDWNLTEHQLTSDVGHVGLVWLTPHGLVGDYIDGQALDDRDIKELCDRPCTDMLAVAMEEFGAEFRSLRVLTISAPRRSVILGADGTRTAIFEEQS